MSDDIEADDYGNPTDGSRLIYCCFPDCGCDGARLCMAEKGASDRACGQNIEGMWKRTDKQAVRARLDLYGSVLQDEKVKK